MVRNAAYRPPDAASGRPGGIEPLRRGRRPGPKLSHPARGLFHAGIHREDIDQTGGFQDPAHRRLRRGQGQVAAAGPGPFPYPQQHGQAAVADALQGRQVHDDRWPADRHGRDQMGCDTRSVDHFELTAQGDDAQTVAVTDAEIHVKHGLPSRSGSQKGACPSGDRPAMRRLHRYGSRSPGALVTTEARVRIFR